MFKFVKELNEHAYQHIVNGVEKSFDSPLFVAGVGIALEEILKPFCKGLLKNSDNITLGKIINERSVRIFLKMQLKITDKEILDIKKINKIYTDVKHEGITPDKEKYLEYYKLLFDVCVKVYTFQFGYKPNTQWDSIYINTLLQNKSNLEEENNLLKESEQKLKDLQEQILEENKALKEELEKYSKQIVKVEIPEQKIFETKNFEYSPSIKPKELTEKSPRAKTNEIKNTINLIQIGKNYHCDITEDQSQSMITDFVTRGWFEQAEKELANLPFSNGDTLYLSLLCKYKKTSIEDLDDDSLIAEVERIGDIINSISSQKATKIIKILLNKYNGFDLYYKSKIFDVLKNFKFVGRVNFINEFGAELEDRLLNQKAVDTSYILSYLSAIEKDYRQTLTKFIELLINSELFTQASCLIDIILEADNKNVYALSKALLVDCKAKNDEILTENFKYLSNFDLFSSFFNEISTNNKNLFLKYAGLAKQYLESENALSNIDTSFKIFSILYGYDYPDREKIKFIMKDQLLKTLETQESYNIFDYLETILKWSISGEEYFKLCQEFAIKSLDSTLNDNRFLKILNEIKPNDYMSKMIQLYYNLGLSLSSPKPLLNETLFKGEEFDVLLRLASKKEKDVLLKELLASLTSAIEYKHRYKESIDENIKLFNYLLSFLDCDKSTLYDIIKNYASALIKNNYFDFAFNSLKQMMSLNVNNHEVSLLMLLCDYKVSNVEDLYNSDTPIIDNEFYKLALKTAYQENKKDYNEYLDIYSNQLEKINKRTSQQEKERIKKEADIQHKIQKKQAKIINFFYIGFLIILAAFLISLAAFFRITGLTIFTILSCIAVSTIIIYLLKDHWNTEYTIKKLITCSIALPLTVAIVIGSLYGIHASTDKMTYNYNSDYVKIKVGCNYNVYTLNVPSKNGSIDIERVSIFCARNNHIETIKIPLGVKRITACDFSDCKNLSAIYIPSSVTTIAYDAFNGTRYYKIYYGGSESAWKKAYTMSSTFGLNRVVFNSYI